MIPRDKIIGIDITGMDEETKKKAIEEYERRAKEVKELRDDINKSNDNELQEFVDNTPDVEQFDG